MSITGAPAPSLPAAPSAAPHTHTQPLRRSASSQGLSGSVPAAQGHLAVDTTSQLLPRSASLPDFAAALRRPAPPSLATSSAWSISAGIAYLNQMEADATLAQALAGAPAPAAPAATPATAHQTTPADVVRLVSQAVIWTSAEALAVYGGFMGLSLGGRGGYVGGAFGALAALVIPTVGTVYMSIAAKAAELGVSFYEAMAVLAEISAQDQAAGFDITTAAQLNRHVQISESQASQLKHSVEAELNKPIKSTDGENRQVEVKARFEAVSKIDLNLALQIFNKAENRKAIADLVQGGRIGNAAAEKLAVSTDLNITKLYVASSRAFMGKERTTAEKNKIKADRGEFYVHLVSSKDAEGRDYFGLPRTESGEDGLRGGQDIMLGNAVDRLNGWLDGKQNNNVGMRNLSERELKQDPAMVAALFLNPETILIPENATLQEFVQRLASPKRFVVAEVADVAPAEDPVLEEVAATEPASPPASPSYGEAGPSRLVKSTFSKVIHQLSGGSNSAAPAEETPAAGSFLRTPFETASVDLMRTQLMGLPESAGISKELIQSEIEAVFDDPQLLDQLHQLAAGAPSAVAALAQSDKVQSVYKLMQMMGLQKWSSGADNILAVKEAQETLELIAEPVRAAPLASENKGDFAKHKFEQLRARRELGLKETDTISPARYAQLKNLLARASLATAAEATLTLQATELTLVAGDIFKYPDFMAIPHGTDVMQAIKKFLQLDFRMVG
jgi:hypothetical protein